MESILQHLILPSLCPLHTTLFPSSPTKHMTADVDTDSLNGAVSSSPLPCPAAAAEYKSLKFHTLTAHSVPAHNWDSVLTIVRKKHPI